jgi:hypothetical protein
VGRLFASFEPYRGGLLTCVSPDLYRYRLMGRKSGEKARKKKGISNLAHCSHTGLPEDFGSLMVLGWKGNESAETI